MLKRTSDIYPAEDVLRFLIQALRFMPIEIKYLSVE